MVVHRGVSGMTLVERHVCAQRLAFVSSLASVAGSFRFAEFRFGSFTLLASIILWIGSITDAFTAAYGKAIGNVSSLRGSEKEEWKLGRE